MKFRNEFGFLSNFALCQIKMRGVIYPTVEHAYQAAKTLDMTERERIAACKSASEAKKMGRRVKMRADWEEIKEEVMLEMLREKFRSPAYRAKLLAIEGEIVEENEWGDTYWGVSKGKGKNRLGVLLMQVRDELR